MSEKSLEELRTANKFLEEENNKLIKKNDLLRERLRAIVEGKMGEMEKAGGWTMHLALLDLDSGRVENPVVKGRSSSAKELYVASLDSIKKNTPSPMMWSMANDLLFLVKELGDNEFFDLCVKLQKEIGFDDPFKTVWNIETKKERVEVALKVLFGKIKTIKYASKI